MNTQEVAEQAAVEVHQVSDTVNEKEVMSTKVKGMIFVVACLVLCMLWGQKLYAARTVQQGEEFTVTNEAAVTATPKVVVKDANNNQVTDQIVANGTNGGYYKQDDASNYSYQTAYFKVSATASAGTYTINLSQGDYYNQTETVTVLGSGTEQETSSVSQAAAASEKPVYVPMTPEEIYQAKLDEQFPSGHTNISLRGGGQRECRLYLRPEKPLSFGRQDRSWANLA